MPKPPVVRLSLSKSDAALPPNFFLVPTPILTEVTTAMKKLYCLIALLGLVGALTGCNEQSSTPPAPSTNAPAAPAAPATPAAPAQK